MSSTTWSRTPGRCTFTATGRPSRSTARCTCPSDALASGIVVEGLEGLRHPHAELGRDDLLDLREPERRRRRPAAAPAPRGTTGGSRSARVDRSCPSLTKVGPIDSRSSTNFHASSSLVLSPPAGSSGSKSFRPSTRPCLTRSAAMSLSHTRCRAFSETAMFLDDSPSTRCPTGTPEHGCQNRADGARRPACQRQACTLARSTPMTKSNTRPVGGTAGPAGGWRRAGCRLRGSRRPRGPHRARTIRGSRPKGALEAGRAPAPRRSSSRRHLRRVRRLRPLAVHPGRARHRRRRDRRPWPRQAGGLSRSRPALQRVLRQHRPVPRGGRDPGRRRAAATELDGAHCWTSRLASPWWSRSAWL